MNYSSAKKKAFLFMALILVLSTFGTSFASDSFSDLQDSSWAASTIEKWSGYGLINGFSDGTFKPKNAITRAEFAVIAYKAFDLHSDLGKSFGDVTKKDWYYDAVSKIAKLGFMNGKAAGIFDPKAYITRSEAAVILANIQGLTANEAGAQVFVDYEAIPSWARGLVGASAHANFISGYSDSTFQGSNTITRAEAVAMLDNTVYGANAFANNWKVVVAGTYGGTVEKPVTVKGNVYVKTADVELKNIIVEGNLVLGIEIGEGEANLTNVVVKGDTNIVGGGKNSIKINGGSYGKVFVMKNSNSPVRLLVTNVKGLDVIIPEFAENVNVLLEGVFNEVRVLAAGSNVTTQGKTTIESFTVEKTAVDVVLQTATGTVIATVVIDVKISVLGQGRIVVADVNVSDVTFEKQPETVNDVPTTPAPAPGPAPGPGPAPVVTKTYQFLVEKNPTEQLVGETTVATTTPLSFSMISAVYNANKSTYPALITTYSDFFTDALTKKPAGKDYTFAYALASRINNYSGATTLTIFDDATLVDNIANILNPAIVDTLADVQAFGTVMAGASLDQLFTELSALYAGDTQTISSLGLTLKVLGVNYTGTIANLRTYLETEYPKVTIETAATAAYNLVELTNTDNVTVKFNLDIK